MTLRDVEKLKNLLSIFDTVTVHAPHLDLNISSCNTGIREESIKQYIECLELARKLDVEIVTFHMGHQTRGYIRSEDEILKHEIEFAKIAADYAKNHGIKVGYETGSVSRLNKILKLFSPNEFGVNLDLGHTIMQSVDLCKVINLWKDYIIEVHFNGVVHYWGGFMEHVPVWYNNCIDYRKVISHLKNIGFQGPIICEIEGNDLDQCIEVVLEAKELIEFLWYHAELLPEDVKPWKLIKIIREYKRKGNVSS